MTPRSLELLFLSFRREGTPAALAELFDCAAPELLRVACHVASDLAAAEDLVQSTFLTAIESATSWDERRALLPWLLGILANHARNARRAGARAADAVGSRPPELRLLPREEPSPLAGLQSRELDARVQRELDALAEPYREVAILALRHDLKPAEIARALGRSPGAVRVQLHRALEQIRQRVPRSAALGALFGGELGRGLASVRALVVKGAATAAGTVAIVSLGGVVVAKKVVVASIAAAAAVVVAAATISTWWPGRGGPEQGNQRDPASAAAASAADSPASADVDAPAPTPAATPTRSEIGEAAPLATPTEPATCKLEGEVLDGVTLQPLAGARVEFFVPLRMKLSAVKRRFADYDDRSSHDGTVRFRGAWPKLVEPIPEGAWRDLVDVELCAAPETGAVALTHALTTSEGKFALATPRHGVIVVTLDGYEGQVVPIVPPQPSWPPTPPPAIEPPPEPLSIALFAAQEVSGVVVDERGQPIHRSLKLLFTGYDRKAGRNVDPKKVQALNQLGPWLVETEPDGTFRFAAGAPDLIARSATVGFEVTLTSHRKKPNDPLRVQVKRRAVLTVLDAATKKPIEDFSLLGISLQHGSPCYGGHFHAREGRIDFETGPRSDHGGRAIVSWEEPLWLDVWSDRHEPARVQLPASNERTDLTLELDAGEPPKLAGHLLRAGAPIAGTTLSLNAYYPLGWREDSLTRIDETATASDGSFTLRGPPGKFVLRVSVDGNTLLRVVELPASAPFELDLARGGRIEVVVRDAAGAPRADAKVYVRDPTDRQDFRFTDEGGQASFESLIGGAYEVSLNGTRETHVPIAQDSEHVQVVDGAVADVELTAPPAGPIHLRIHAEGTTDYTGWQARDGTYLSSEWDELAADGAMSTDSSNWTNLEVRSKARSTWRVPLTPEILADGVLKLRVNDLGYRGRVLDRATGAPLANAMVRASRAEPWELITARADAEGRFVIENLEGEKWSLSVTRAAPPGPRGGYADEDQPEPTAWFSAAQPPAPGGREVTLRVPEVRGSSMAGVPRRVFFGRVTRKGTGAAVDRATLGVTAHYVDDDGEWWVSVQDGIGRSGVDGTFQIVAAVAPSYHVWISEEGPSRERKSTAETWLDGGGAAEREQHDVVLE